MRGNRLIPAEDGGGKLEGALQALYRSPVFRNSLKEVRLLEYLIEHEQERAEHGSPFVIKQFYVKDAANHQSEAPSSDVEWTDHPGKPSVFSVAFNRVASVEIADSSPAWHTSHCGLAEAKSPKALIILLIA